MKFKFRGKNHLNKYYSNMKIDAFVFNDGKVISTNNAALLIGYDKHGNRIYSNDKVIDSDGNEHCADEYFPLKLDVIRSDRVKFKDKNGHPIIVGDVVTYDIFDETPTLLSIRPDGCSIKGSRLVVGEIDGEYYLRWFFGGGHCFNAPLDEASAKVIRVIGHDDSLRGDSYVD